MKNEDDQYIGRLGRNDRFEKSYENFGRNDARASGDTVKEGRNPPPPVRTNPPPQPPPPPPRR